MSFVYPWQYIIMLVGQSKWLKQIIQIKPNRVKNPNWPEANQLAIYKRDLNLGLLWTNPARIRAGLELRASKLEVQAQVVQKLDNAIHRINHSPADMYYRKQLRYPLDSAIQRLNNQGLCSNCLPKLSHNKYYFIYSPIWCRLPLPQDPTGRLQIWRWWKRFITGLQASLFEHFCEMLHT